MCAETCPHRHWSPGESGQGATRHPQLSLARLQEEWPTPWLDRLSCSKLGFDLLDFRRCRSHARAIISLVCVCSGVQPPGLSKVKYLGGRLLPARIAAIRIKQPGCGRSVPTFGRAIIFQTLADVRGSQPTRPSTARTCKWTSSPKSSVEARRFVTIGNGDDHRRTL